MTIGTSHVTKRFKGRRRSACIESGAVRASRAAVATTNAMSMSPRTFQIE